MKQRVLLYLTFVVVSVVLGSSCQRSEKVLDRKKMEKLMYDVYLAEALMDSDPQIFNTPQKKEALIHQVLSKHNTSQEQWDRSLSYYSDNAGIYLRMNDSVKARIQVLYKEADSLYKGYLAAKRDIENKMKIRSYIPPVFSFSDPIGGDGLTFLLDSADVATKIESPEFYFNFDVFGIPEPEEQPLLKSLLTLSYSDTIIYMPDTISRNTNYMVKASKYIKDDTLKTMSGFVRLLDSIGEPQQRNILLYNIRFGTIETDTTSVVDYDDLLFECTDSTTANPIWKRFKKYYDIDI